MIQPDGTIRINSHLPASTIMLNPEWIKAGVEYYFNTHAFFQLFDPADPTAEDAHAPLTLPDNHTKGKRPTSPLVSIPRRKVFSAIPTPESFAQSIGFASFNTLKRTLDNPDYPEASRHYLLVGCSIIADMLTRAGLTEKMSVTFTKFIMSAYLGISEKTEVYKTEDNRITIMWGELQLTANGETTNTLIPHNPLASQETLIEMERLESALPEGMRMYGTTSPTKTSRDMQVMDIM